uniref:Alpha-1,4-N-acetylglucosaminyltransferase n=1 Tax=Lygus hesperus TaxID=30085 RepID=A0A0A9YQF1_LYGHE
MMTRLKCMWLFWLMALLCIAIYTALMYHNVEVRKYFIDYRYVFNSPDDFEGFDNVSGTADGCYIVPNIIHFIRFDQPRFLFTDAVCVLAALKHQRPDKIYFHTDSKKFVGPYWDVIMSTPGAEGVIELKDMAIPDQVFGQNFNVGWRRWHASDVMRLKILMKYGGIYLDNDAYIVKSLNKFKAFEMTVSWQDRMPTQINNQVIIAHKNARFLREWLLTYRGNYNKSIWYYNAGIRPVEEVLSKRPELVHRGARWFSEYPGIGAMLYLDHSGVWKDHYAIHMYVNHMVTLVTRNWSSVATYPVVFNETNIHVYDVNFRDMVYDVYPFRQTVSSDEQSSIKRDQDLKRAEIQSRLKDKYKLEPTTSNTYEYSTIRSDSPSSNMEGVELAEFYNSSSVRDFYKPVFSSPWQP